MLGGADAQRARDLAAAMPPSCRAVVGDAPGTLLGSALDALADAAARARLTAPLLPARRGRIPARLPLAERYVMALTTADARVDVVTPEDEAEAAALAAELDAWRDGAVIPAGPVRTCFRLAEAAAAEADPWRVEFALQSADDPSLMVSAADVWSGLGAGLAAGRDPVEELLAGLGAAARLFGDLDDALREAAPALVEMDITGAFRFLKETGPLLAGAGFGVLLPDWVRKARLGLKLTTRSRTASGTSSAGAGVARFGLGDLVDFRYDVAVGDQALDPGELAELARLKVPLVRLRGQWVELDDAHLKAALKFLERNQAGTMTAADALTAGMGLGLGREGAGAGGPGEEIPLVGVDADGWLGDLLSGQADHRLRPMPTPPGFSGELRPYQQRGLSWLSFLGELGLGGILADDMGLGKTIQLLSLVAGQSGGGRGGGPTLLVCPMSLVGNWQREAARFTPDLRVHVHHGADRLDGESLAALLAGGGPGHHHLRRGHQGPGRARPGELGPGGLRRGAEYKESRHQAGQGGTCAARGGQDRADRDAGGEPAVRAVVDHGLHQPGPARSGRTVPGAVRGPDRAARLARGHAGAQAAHPAVHAPPPENRQDDHLRPAG